MTWNDSEDADEAWRGEDAAELDEDVDEDEEEDDDYEDEEPCEHGIPYDEWCDLCDNFGNPDLNNVIDEPTE